LLIVYDSATGKTERFVKKTNLPCVKITKGLSIKEPFILVTYTTGNRTEPARVPDNTLEFLENNYKNMLGVASSGHGNWGKDRYAKAGDLISRKYDVPLILKFEMGGYPSDIENFVKGAVELYDNTDNSINNI
jgi:protein involved in ribonucleotide reduction